MDNLSYPQVRDGFVEQAKHAAAAVLYQKQRGRVALAELGKARQNGPQVRSNVRQDVPVPVPPFWGPRVVTGIRLKDVVASLDRNALYRLQWGAKNAKGAAWDQLKAEFDLRVRD